MKPARRASRHGLNAAKTRVALRGWAAIDMRTAAAQEMVSFRAELTAALGGEGELSPQRKKLIDLAARASLYLDHVDSWLAAQETFINRRARSVFPVLLQRQALADHVARILDKLGLDRQRRQAPSLDQYLVQKYGKSETSVDGVETVA